MKIQSRETNDEEKLYHIITISCKISFFMHRLIHFILSRSDSDFMLATILLWVEILFEQITHRVCPQFFLIELCVL